VRVPARGMTTQRTSRLTMATGLATLPEAAQRLRQDTESAKARSQQHDGMAGAADVALAAAAASRQRRQK
jgi:hypothetical protein